MVLGCHEHIAFTVCKKNTQENDSLGTGCLLVEYLETLRVVYKWHVLILL